MLDDAGCEPRLRPTAGEPIFLTMCGRYPLFADPDLVARAFGVDRRVLGAAAAA